MRIRYSGLFKGAGGCAEAPTSSIPDLTQPQPKRGWTDELAKFDRPPVKSPKSKNPKSPAQADSKER